MTHLLGFPDICVFTDTFHRSKPDSDAQLEEKNTTQYLQYYPVVAMVPHLNTSMNWHRSSAQVVGRSWWCTFPIFQSGCLSTDTDLDKSVKEKFTRAYLKWCLDVNSSTEWRNGSRICSHGMTFKRKGWSLNQMTTQISLSSSNILSTTLGHKNSLGLG